MQEIDRGILSWIRADDMPRIALLPPPGPTQSRYVTQDHPHASYGPLRFTFRCMRAKHHKSIHWFWVPCRAEQLDPSARRPGDWLERSTEQLKTDWRGQPVAETPEG